MKNMITIIFSLIISGFFIFIISIFILDYRYNKNDNKVIKNVNAATTGTCYSANNKLNTLTPKEYIVPELEDGITINSGGYYIVGNMVVFNMIIHIPSSITLSSDVNNGTKIMSGIPEPLEGFMQIPVFMAATSTLIHPTSTIIKNVNLYLINSNNLYHYDYGVTINGSYMMV